MPTSQLLILLLASVLGTNALPAHSIGEAPPEFLSAGELSSPQALLEKTLDAVGGRDSLALITGLRMESSYIYRTQTLTQNYNLMHSDQAVSSAGSQNLSLSFSSQTLLERIDRRYQYDEYWLWAFPDLQPIIDYSLIVHDSDRGFACFDHGQNSFFAEDPSEAGGFTDAYLADYLVHQAHQYALPWLLTQFAKRSADLRLVYITMSHTNLVYPALELADFGVEIIVDNLTYVPFTIRSHEVHSVYGNSTSDLVLSNFTMVVVDEAHSVFLPHRIQTIYNEESVLEDFIVDALVVNPAYSAEFFEPRILNETSGGPPQTPMAPMQNPEYPRSEVHEFFEAGLWGGPFGEMFNISDIVIRPISPNVPQISSLYVGYPDYIQVLVEFEDGLIITDAPAHRSKIVLEWVDATMGGKKVTHVVPSHHHRDHAGGVGDYVAAGASLVIPEIARDFYAQTNDGNVSIITYTEDAPFQKKDSNVQFRSMWHAENPHASDWTYSIATKSCPSEDSEVVVFVVDVVNPGGEQALRWDLGYARQWLLQAIDDGLPQNATIVGSHGSSEEGLGTQDSLDHITQLAGLRYPGLKAQDWTAGGPLC